MPLTRTSRMQAPHLPSGFMREQFGLIAAGGVSQSFLARLPSFLARLGPVRGTSYHVSRRIALSIRHGYAASHYSMLEPCSVIWISVPEPSLDRIVTDLVAQTPIHRTMVVLVGVTRDSRLPGPLLKAGARVATLNALEGSGERNFVAEGHRDTLRVLHRLFSEDKRKVIELVPSAKPFYFAGARLSSNLLLPLISAAVESFRMAGFTQTDALAVAGSLSIQAAYTYEKSGRKAWTHRLSAEIRHALLHEVEPLRATDPRLAEAYAEGLRQALAYFERPLAQAAAKRV